MKYLAFAGFLALAACVNETNSERCPDPALAAAGYEFLHPTKPNVCIKSGMAAGEGFAEAVFVAGALGVAVATGVIVP